MAGENDVIRQKIVFDIDREPIAQTIDWAGEKMKDKVENFYPQMINTYNLARTYDDQTATLHDAEMPEVYSKYLASIRGVIKSQVKEVTTLIGQISDDALDDTTKSTITAQLKRTVGNLAANLEDAISSSTDVKRIVSSIKPETTKEISLNMHQMLHRANDVLSQAFSNTFSSMTDSAYETILKMDKSYSAGIEAMSKKYGLNDKTIQSMNRLAIRRLPFFMRTDYAQMAAERSGFNLVDGLNAEKYSTWQERLPEIYKHLETLPQKTPSSGINTAFYRRNLSAEDYQLLREEASRNLVLEQALINAKVAKREVVNGRAGILTMPEKPITNMQLARVLGHIHQDSLIPALEGRPSNYRKITSQDPNDIEAMANTNNRAARESFAIFNMLAHTGVLPMYGRQERYNPNATYTPVENYRLSIRPDQYQVMSLTLEDFMSGKRLDPKGVVQDIYEERNRGYSVNKMISENGLTRAIGMYGNNTLGNGSKTENAHPAIIYIDTTKDLIDANENGEVYKDGRPVQDLKTRQRIAELFTHKKTYEANGKTHEYPVIPYGNSGDSYVPAFAKNGSLVMVREDEYVAASKRSYENVGYNTLHNLVDFFDPNMIFGTQTELAKTYEASNRILTPTKRIDEYGSSVPNSSKTAFVDLKTILGHDGSSFFMPGYIPGDNATFRLAGMKGVAQTVDFHQLIKDLTGQDHFYAPGSNAPEEIKNLFKDKGIRAVQKALNNEDFAKYMVDLMQYDALIDASVTKSPVFKNAKTQEELRDIYDRVLRTPEGFGIGKTAADFISEKDIYGAQVAAKLHLTDEEARKNQEQWEQRIDDLRYHPEKVVNELFPDENNSFDKRIRDNPNLMWTDPLARERLVHAIATARLNQIGQRIDTNKELAMGLAAQNPAELVLELAKLNGARIIDKQLAQNLRLGENTIATNIINGDDISGHRWPGTYGQFYGLKNDTEFLNTGRQYHLAPNVIYTNMDTIHKMGGGDVDGDTIQLVRGRLAKLIRESEDFYRSNVSSNGELKPEDIVINRGLQGTDVADLLYRSVAQSIILGSVSNAQDALEQVDWSDPNLAKMYGTAAGDLAQLYDLDSVFLKTNVVGKMTKSARMAQNLGTPFSHSIKNLLGAISTNNYAGMKPLSKVNFPSRFHAGTVSLLGSMAENPLSIGALETFIQAQETLEGIPELRNGNRLDQKKAEVLSANISMMSQMLTGKAGKVSKNDFENYIGLVAILGNEISLMEKSGAISADQAEKYKSFARAQNARIEHGKLFGLIEGYGRTNPGYSGSVSHLPATGQFSIAETAAKAEDDAKILAMNIAMASNPLMIDAVAQAGINEQNRINGLETLYNKRHSFSALHLLADSNMLEYIKKHVANPPVKEELTRSAALGKAIDYTMGEWAKDRMAQQEGQEAEINSDKYQRILEDYLYGRLEKADKGYSSEEMKKLFPVDMQDKSAITHYDENLRNKYSSTLSFARGLPRFMLDEDILGYQVETQPNLGNYTGTQRQIKTIGFIDLMTRNKKSGKVTEWDLKPYSQYDSVEDQLALYFSAGENNSLKVKPDALGVISYYMGDTLRKLSLTPENIKSTVDKYAGIVNNTLKPIAEKGWTIDSFLDAIGKTPEEFGNEVYQDKIKQIRQKDAEETGSKKREYYANAIDARSIGEAIALESKAIEYENRLQEIEDQYAKDYRRRERGDTKTNMWAARRAQLDNITNEILDYQTQGISLERLNSMKQHQERIQKEYDKDFAAALYGDHSDLVEATNNFDTALNQRVADKTMLGLSKEFESVQSSIERATQAYKVFEEELTTEEGQKKYTTDQIKKIEDQKAAFDASAKSLELAISSDAKRYAGSQALILQAKYNNRFLSNDEKADTYLASVMRELTGYKSGIADLEEKGLLGSKNIKYQDVMHSTLFKMLDSQVEAMMNEDSMKQIKTDYVNQLKAREDILNKQYAIRSEQALIQSEQSARQWNMRGYSNPFTRNYMQRYSMYDQLRGRQSSLELQRDQEQIRFEKLKEQQAEVNSRANSSQKDKDEVAAVVSKAEASLNNYNKALETTQSQMEKFQGKNGQFSETWNSVGATIETVAQAGDKLIQQFGRRMFQKAFQEAKNFVVQFDSQMRSIQAITMKTDEEMQTVRKATIDRAIELKTSVANVAQVEADLYRQGLNDQQVEERASAIVKFATVTGAKMTDAGKAITTAIQNGLVASAEEAMDVLTALGDSAATTAEQIFKGMQKSAAAAKVAGVSYDELTTLLTIGTSKTQLTGQVIGTGLQTIFSRMNRVTNTGYVNDETGASVTINDVEKALSSAGVQLREADGKSFRNSFEVLRDLSKVWESLTDIQRSNITYTMAGGRQQNIFQSLMEGMAEDGGAELDRLLGLAENSEGSTESKYEIAIKSISAALEELKSTYDGFVGSMSSDGFLVGSIESITSFVDGLKSITENSTGAAGGISLITAAVVGLVAAVTMAASGAPGLIVTLVGALAGGGILGIASLIGQNQAKNSNDNTEDQAKKQIEEADKYYNNTKQKRIDPIREQIEEVKKLGEAYDKAKKADEEFTPEQTIAFESKLNDLSKTFATLTGNINDNKTSIDEWKNTVQGLENAINEIDVDAAKAADAIALTSFKTLNPIDELVETEMRGEATFNGFVGHVDESDLDWFMSMQKEYPTPGKIRNLVDKYGEYLSPYLLNAANSYVTNGGLKRNQAEDLRAMLVNAIGIGFDPYDTATLLGYDNFKNTKEYSDWLDSFNSSEKKVSIGAADSLAEMFVGLTEEEKNSFLRIFGQFMSTDNQTQYVNYYNKQTDTKRKERISNLLKVLKQDDIITSGNEVLAKALEDRLFNETKNVRAEEFDQAINSLLGYYLLLNEQEIESKLLKPEDYDYQYRDSNGSILFGFNDLDKAEEEYNKYFSGLQYENIETNETKLIDKQVKDLQQAIDLKREKMSNYRSESELESIIAEREKQVSKLNTIAVNKKELYEAQKAQVDKNYKPGEEVPEPVGKTLVNMYQDYARAYNDWWLENDTLSGIKDEYDFVHSENLGISAMGKQISDLLFKRKEASASQGKTILGFDISNIFNKNGNRTYQDLSGFIGDQTIQKQDYIDTYEKLLGYMSQNVDYENLENSISNVAAQLPNFTGVVANDQELLKMLQSFEKKDGRYNYQQLYEYVQSKALGESLNTTIANASSSAYKYSEQMSAIKAIQNGTATNDQYNMVAQQYGLTRNEMLKNPELYQTLETMRLQSEKNNLEQNVANYISGWLRSGYTEEQLKKMSVGGFSNVWNSLIGDISKTNPEKANELTNALNAFIASGYVFSIDENGNVSSTLNNQDIAPEDALNPYAWNRNLGRAQARSDVMEYLENGKLTGDNVQQRIQNMESYSSELAQYINLSEEARESAEGLAILEQIKIKIKVDGLSDLAALGQMSQEAVTWAQQLATGGTMRFEALKSIRSESASRRNLIGLANVQNRTSAQNREIMQALGIDNEDEYYTNQERYNAEFLRYINSEEYRTSLANDYSNAISDATTREDKIRIRREALALGATYKNGKLQFGEGYYKNVQRTDQNLLSDYTDRLSREVLQAEMAKIVNSEGTYELKNEDLYNQLANAYGADVMKTLANKDNYSANEIAIAENAVAMTNALMSIKELTQLGELSSSAEGLVTNLLGKDPVEAASAVAQVTSELTDLQKLATALNTAPEERTDSQWQLLMQLTGISKRSDVNENTALEIAQAQIQQWLNLADQLNESAPEVAETIRTMLNGGNISGISFKENLLDSHEVQLTTASLMEYVDQLVAAGEGADGMFGNLPETIQQQLSGFAGLADYIKTYGENTREAAQAQKELSDAILEGTLKALEDEGKIITGMAESIKTIADGNVLDSMKTNMQMINQFTDMANASAAFRRLNEAPTGQQRMADWDTVASYIGMSDEMKNEYISGSRNLNALSGFFNDNDELIRDSVLDFVEKSIEKEAGSALYGNAGTTEWLDSLAKYGSPAVAESLRTRKRMTGAEYLASLSPEARAAKLAEYADYAVRWNEENNALEYVDLATADLSLLDKYTKAKNRRAALVDYGNKNKDLDLILNNANLRDLSVDELIKYIAEQQYVSNYFDQFLTSDELHNLIEQGGTGQNILDILYKERYGQERENATRFSNVQSYIDALLSGSISEIPDLSNEEYEDIASYLFSIEGAQEAYNTLRSGQNLERYQIDALKAGAAYQRVYEGERNGEYRKGTADFVRSFVTGTDAERTQALYEQGEERRKYEETADAVDKILQDTSANNDLYWQQIQENGKLNDEQIKYYKEHVDELEEVRGDMNKEIANIDKGLVAAFGLENLDEFTEPGHKALLEAARKMLNLSGLELEVNGNNVSIGRDQRTPYEILTSVADLSGYGANKAIRDQQNQFVRAIMESGSIEEFESVFNELFAGMSEGNIRKIIGTDWQTMLGEMMSGDYSWAEMQNKFAQSSRYAPFYRDLSFENNYEKAQGYFGEGFGYSSEINPLTSGQIDQFINDEGLVNWIQNIEGGTEVLQELASTGKVSDETMRKFNANFASARIKDLKKYGDDTDSIANSISDLNKDARSTTSALGSLISRAAKLNDQGVAAQKARGKKGSQLDSRTRGILSQASGIDEAMIKEMTEKEIDDIANWVEKAAGEEFENTIGASIGEQLVNSIQKSLSGRTITIDDFVKFDINGDGQLDMSEVEAAARSLNDEALAQLAAFAGKIADLTLQTTENGDTVSVEAILNSFKGNYSSKGGGGGGGGKKKSKAEELLEKQKREQAQRSHEIKMIQYQETKYENAGELSNVNRMLELENKAQEKYQKTLRKNIEDARKQMAQTKKGSDDGKNLYDAILSCEEALEESTIAVAENTKKIKENKQAIYQMRSELEQTVLTEIENRKQIERSMLEGSVSMQDIVLEAIRQRYRDEWALIEKDVEKKKQALEEEKNLIDERLQRRKDAEDEAEKYEELAEYKKQLALIEMDSTRTKDAAKLRTQIADLEKEIAWDVAEDEAEYQKEIIDDQIQAYDDFITYGSEDLEDYLENANNLADEVNKVMKKSQTGLITWLKNNVKEYALSLDDAQEQMVQGWTDTYEQMLNITHTYWDEIAEILSGKNTFLKYMKASQEYQDASTAERKQMLYDWGEMYDNYIAAQKKDAVYSHTDDELSGIGKTETKKSSGGGSSGSNNQNAESEKESEYKEPVITFSVIEEPKTLEDLYTERRAKAKAAQEVSEILKTGAEIEDRETRIKISAYASGGLVDYTGPAWVDGTPTKPEAFLSAEDTLLIRSFLDEAKYVRYRSSVSNIDSSSYSGNNQNIGEVIINITEAQFKDDADFDEVANRVGDKFVKELAKQGIHTLSYSF